MKKKEKFFIGFDLSTQQLKCIVIDGDCALIAHCFVNFADEFPHYRTQNGVHRGTDCSTVTSPVYMWLDAIDVCIDKLSKIVDLSKVIGISGCAQQHGTVYWSKRSMEQLAKLGEAVNLRSGLKYAFTKKDSPIWMDSSTGDECKTIENAVGGPMELAKITGSRAFHRFSLSQILKIIRNEREVYEATERISLVSSFLASIFCGKIVGIDLGDAGGMNLLDMRGLCWSDLCLEKVFLGDVEQTKKLKNMLGEISSPQMILGTITPYFQRKYGFQPNCKILPFTGDNLCSNLAAISGLCLKVGDIAISLGTSDTVLISTNKYQPQIEGHLFINVTDPRGYMGMLCFKNGSFTRDRIRSSVKAPDWKRFSELLTSTVPGNEGNIGFYFDDNEILPYILHGDYRFNAKNERVCEFSDQIEVRAVIEHQCLAKRLYAEKLGYSVGSSGRVLVTGGASKNAEILQVLADVFNTAVYRTESFDSAAYGGALRARHAVIHSNKDFFDVSMDAVPFKLVATPSLDHAKVYNEMLERYASLEKQIKVDCLI